MKAIKPSQTIRSTTDHPPQTSNQVKPPFKLILVVPPKKKVNENSKTGNQASSSRNNNDEERVEIDLRLEPEPRRPLSPLQNSATSKREFKKPEVLCEISQHKDRGSEPAKSVIMDFEAIDERSLPMLAENYEEVVGSQIATRSQPSELDVINNQLECSTAITPIQNSTVRIENREHPHVLTEQEITVETSTTEPSIRQTMQIQPTSGYYSSNSTVQVSEDQPAPVVVFTASKELDTNQDIEMTSDLSTLNGPSGLLIGKKTHIVGNRVEHHLQFSTLRQFISKTNRRSSRPMTSNARTGVIKCGPRIL